jgi:hypothetical protein
MSKDPRNEQADLLRVACGDGTQKRMDNGQWKIDNEEGESANSAKTTKGEIDFARRK